MSNETGGQRSPAGSDMPATFLTGLRAGWAVKRVEKRVGSFMAIAAL
jgi:hypothetical protein